jgi:hypothetical protein
VAGFRFLQVGDVRFGTLPRLPQRGIPARLRQVLVQDRDRLLARVLELAREHRADLVLMPGDVIDDARATPEEAEAIMLGLAELAPRPVVVSPGELDPAHPTGYWSPETLTMLGKSPLPANLHVFRSADAHTMVLGTVAVTGWATPPRLALVGRSPPADPQEAGPQRDAGSAVAPAPSPATPTAPDAATRPEFQPEWLAARLPAHVEHRIVVAHQVGPHLASPPVPSMVVAMGLRYMALGHEAEPALLADGAGAVRVGWAGHPLAHELPGPTGGIVCGVVDADGRVQVELVEIDARRAHVLDCDVGAVQEPGGVVAQIAATLERARVRPQDLVWMRLVGSWVHPVLPRVPSAALAALCMHLSVSIADLDVTLPPGETVRDLHLAGLVPRHAPPRSPTSLEALRMALAAWDGEEVTASSEDPPAPV